METKTYHSFALNQRFELDPGKATSGFVSGGERFTHTDEYGRIRVVVAVAFSNQYSNGMTGGNPHLILRAHRIKKNGELYIDNESLYAEKEVATLPIWVQRAWEQYEQTYERCQAAMDAAVRPPDLSLCRCKMTMADPDRRWVTHPYPECPFYGAPTPA